MHHHKNTHNNEGKPKFHALVFRLEEQSEIFKKKENCKFKHLVNQKRKCFVELSNNFMDFFFIVFSGKTLRSLHD